LGKIGNDEASSWLEHPRDFGESLTLERIGQMVHHEGTEHNVESPIGKVDLFDHADLEFDGQVAPRSFRTGTGDLLHARINAADASGSAKP
jgi:hypothetical protein